MAFYGRASNIATRINVFVDVRFLTEFLNRPTHGPTYRSPYRVAECGLHVAGFGQAQALQIQYSSLDSVLNDAD